jgi:hypothetical protein
VATTSKNAKQNEYPAPIGYEIYDGELAIFGIGLSMLAD